MLQQQQQQQQQEQKQEQEQQQQQPQKTAPKRKMSRARVLCSPSRHGPRAQLLSGKTAEWQSAQDTLYLYALCTFVAAKDTFGAGT